jgi:hypothetical protein
MKLAGSPNILIVTIPIRPIPTDFPPVESLSVIKALKKSGFSKIEFYGIYYLRPSFSEVLDCIERKNRYSLSQRSIALRLTNRKRLSLNF